jgi:hypothetical protein
MGVVLYGAPTGIKALASRLDAIQDGYCRPNAAITDEIDSNRRAVAFPTNVMN